MLHIFNFKKIIIPSLIISIFLGCESKPKNEMSEVHWDRDMCNRCAMVVSDRKNSVQILNPKSHKSYMFDDLGCAIIWFNEEKILDKNEAIIWVNDTISGEWIDAKNAYYDNVSITPMAFGYGAYKSKEAIKSDVVFTFEEVYNKISKRR